MESQETSLKAHPLCTYSLEFLPAGPRWERRRHGKRREHTNDGLGEKINSPELVQSTNTRPRLISLPQTPLSGAAICWCLALSLPTSLRSTRLGNEPEFRPEK